MAVSFQQNAPTRVMSPTSDTDQLYALVLAAGCSRRLGQPKQLLAWNGRTLLEWSIIKAQAVCPHRCLVILGSHTDVIRQSISQHDAPFIDNPYWSEGIASSIRSGIHALPSEAKAVILLLCDQPLIESHDLANLINAWDGDPNRIVACEYSDQAGVPAIFPRRYFKALMALSGDQGAKRLLRKYADKVVTIRLQAACHDIDHWDDYCRLTAIR